MVAAGTALSRYAIASPRVPAWDGSGSASLGFTTGTVVLVIAAPVLAISAQRLADETGITSTFVGTSLVAIVTTLPELVTSFAAVRLGAFDLAVWEFVRQ